MGKFSTNISAGAGFSINSIERNYDYDIKTESGAYIASGKSNSSEIALTYTIGINETYAIKPNWAVGVDVNYTSV